MATEIKIKTDYLATLAKVLIVFIIIIEVIIVTWLPNRLKQGELFEQEIAYQNCSLLLDELRTETRDKLNYKRKRPDVTTPLVREVMNKLDSKAWFLRNNTSRLTAEQVTMLHNELLAYKKVLSKIKMEPMNNKLPDIDQEQLIEDILK